MSFVLGRASQNKLVGVKPQLVEVVRAAILITDQDFTVYEGLRTQARQMELVQQGYSKTLDSKHRIQQDSYGHAVDLVPWIQGHPVWDWDGCCKIADAMDAAATHLGYADHITWGAVWDKPLSAYGGGLESYRAEIEAYKKRHNGPDFLDGPHFQWKD